MPMKADRSPFAAGSPDGDFDAGGADARSVASSLPEVAETGGTAPAEVVRLVSGVPPAPLSRVMP
ncbi:hypothetical protein [Kitasatospora camelliae]|uniref:Uncharacterized protein n=1 Tax=Kitasatospora camelliae TaxID=3156397 RepID=A0AAU8JVE7_9ACTN